MNKAILIGRLTADPELQQTKGGTAVCKFTLAITRRHAQANGERQADFLPIIVWRQLGELCHKYLSKGKQAAVTGEIQTRSYDAQDGTKRYVTEIIADSVEFLTPKGASGSDTIRQAQSAFGADFVEVEDDELPF